MNQQKHYVPPGVAIYRIEPEGVIADSVQGTIKNSSIDVNDYEDNTYSADDDLLLI
jgi:hypothetical protein